MYMVVCGLVLLLLLILVVNHVLRRRARAKAQEQSPPRHKPVQLVHELRTSPVKEYEVPQKDSLDELLDELTRKLAEKEGQLRLSKSKLRETKCEILSLHTMDSGLQQNYRRVLECLRGDLCNVEMECRKLQDEIESVSQKRAELKEEVRHRNQMFGQAATELANNLTELQKGRPIRMSPNAYNPVPSIYSDFGYNGDKPAYSCESVIREVNFPPSCPFHSLNDDRSPNYSERSVRMCKKE